MLVARVVVNRCSFAQRQRTCALNHFAFYSFYFSAEWLQHVATEGNLKKFTEQTEVFFMNPPRDNNVVVATTSPTAAAAANAGSSPTTITTVKPLLVLDLDHTLLDFSSKTLQRDGSTHVVGQGLAAVMKRPYMDEFLTSCYQYYDLVVWSQTSWRWLETKLTELGMVSECDVE
jgi:ubiquitin-like domain-containing CTD phosphatase 1